MNVLSLFSGIGGLDLGLERAGMTVVGQVEIDPYCQRVLTKHWPEVPRHDDVRTAVEWWVGEPRPAVDVVCGGFPCQPVSHAGKRRVQADHRWLWPAAWAVIRDLRPAWAVLENVPGLLARGMGDVLGDLAEGGYDARWDCVPASAVGAPHRRDRVFVVAHPGGQSGRLQPVAKSGSGSTAVAGDDGTPGNVANADSTGLEGQRASRPLAEVSGPIGAGAPVADTDQQRRDRWPGLLEHRWAEPADCGWWSAEPDVGRVATRVPGRVDRLRGLGNAVVPQVAEHIGRLVMAVST